MKKFSKEQLEKIGLTEDIGIHDLRNYARAVGVKNPTYKKRKEDLFNDILDIKEGRVAPVSPSGRGKPPLKKSGFYPAPQAGAASFLSDRNLQSGYAAGRALFDAFKPLYPSVELGTPFGLLRGQRVLIMPQGANDGLKTLKELADSLADTKLYTLLLGAPPEAEADFSERGAGEKIVLPLGTPHTEQIKTALFYLSHAKESAAEGQNVVLAVYFFDSLYRAFCQKDPAEALTAATAYFGAGRDLDGAGSLTLIAFVRDTSGIFLDAVTALANKVVADH